MRTLVALLVLCAAASATTVTGKAVDPNGNPYTGTVSAYLYSSSTPISSGKIVNPSLGPLPLAADGSFTISVTGTDTITPAGSVWQFTFCGPSIPNPPYNASQIICFDTLAVSITGTSLDITATVANSAKVLGPPTDATIRAANNTFTGTNSFKSLNGILFADPQAVTAALTSCMAAGGGKVVLPPGTINLTSTLTWTGHPCDLEGAGRGITVLQMVDATNNQNGIVPSSGSKIEHLTLFGTGAGSCGTNTANGITGALSNVTVNDVEVGGFTCQNINSGNGSNNWTITNNYIHDGLNEGILYGQSTNGTIVGNHIYKNARNGIDLGGSSFMLVADNDVYQNGGTGASGLDKDGILLFSNAITGNSNHIVISGNNVHDNNQNGISASTSGAGDTGGQIQHISITGNIVHNNGVGDSGANVGGSGIILRNNGGNGSIVGFTIAANTVTGTISAAGTCQGDGICLQSDAITAGAFNTGTVVGNTLLSNGKKGLEITSSNVADAVASGNTFIGNTSGAYTDSGTRTGLHCNHSQTLSGGCELDSGVRIGPSGTFLNKLAKYTATLSPVAVAANTCAQQSFTVTGVASGDIIWTVAKPTSQAGLSVAGGLNGGTNTVAINFCNNTASPITPTAGETYAFIAGQ